MSEKAQRSVREGAKADVSFLSRRQDVAILIQNLG